MADSGSRAPRGRTGAAGATTDRRRSPGAAGASSRGSRGFCRTAAAPREAASATASLVYAVISTTRTSRRQRAHAVHGLDAIHPRHLDVHQHHRHDAAPLRRGDGSDAPAMTGEGSSSRTTASIRSCPYGVRWTNGRPHPPGTPDVRCPGVVGRSPRSRRQDTRGKATVGTLPVRWAAGEHKWSVRRTYFHSIAFSSADSLTAARTSCVRAADTWFAR